jgi:hypothetical protein
LKKRPLTVLGPIALGAACLSHGPLTAVTARADEGMWTFNRFPAEKVGKAYGFTPDQKWLDHVRLSSLRLEGGCSGSFVSENGLVMTNHHCAEECIDELSTPKRDYMSDGFYAKTPADEKRCPTQAVNVLVEIADVTARVQGVRTGKSDKDGGEALKSEIAQIEKACQTAPDLRCEVVSLYNGGVYDLYTYRRYEDVRLVFAPEFRIAFFGGDPDNFEFPRYDLDASFLRVYKDGKPLDTKANHFAWSPAGTKNGELTFTAGNPGSTNRLWTLAEIETWRDFGLIPRLLYLSELRGGLLAYAQRGKEQARHSRGELFGIENSYKAFRGELDALLDPNVLSTKRAEEKLLRDHVAADKGRQAMYGGAWEAIAGAQRTWAQLYLRNYLIETGRGFRSDLFGHARLLLRAAEELPKPNEKRLREYTEGEWAGTKQYLLGNAPVYAEFEIFRLSWSLGKMRELLGADDPFIKAVLGNESPAQLAARVIKGSKLADPKVREKLLAGGAAAIAASNDPLIELARKADTEARAVRKRMEDEVESVVGKNHELIAKVRFEKLGTSVYPDATFTPRVSYGSVQGYEENGQKVSPYTLLSGAFDRHTGADPFALPPSWLAKKSRLDLNLPFDFVTSNDIVGGNSGSPVINRDAQIVGLIFDGNIQSLGGDYGFDPALNRAVAVDSRALLYALDVVYGAERLLSEIKAGK